ncbi:unnamed protein product [Polarella glacialis]|uniref:Carbonic anhydrase n=1 Tax=Polarella glacialis TaxID=89957 RepID=A0A813K8J9_POLGL|nr:unnamed protein product [Polarella glacialis]
MMRGLAQSVARYGHADHQAFRPRSFSRLAFTMPGQTSPTAPVVASSAFAAPSADLIGGVVVGEAASIWYQCVLRADVARISVGRGSNVQDGTVIHVASSGLKGNEKPTLIGENCTIGHQALLHACTLEDRAFVGMQACIMDDAVLQSDSIVAAGSLVTPGKVVRSGELWGGRPAKRMRLLTDDEVAFILKSAEFYQELAAKHRHAMS